MNSNHLRTLSHIVFVNFLVLLLTTAAHTESFSGGSMGSSSDSTLIYDAGGLWSTYFGLARSDSTAYVGATTGIMVLDLTNPSAPRQVNFVHQPGFIGDMVADDSLLAAIRWVAAETSYVDIYSIANALAPKWLGTTQIAGNGKSMTLIDNRLYICSSVPWWPDSLISPRGVRFNIYDIAMPSHPALLGYCDLDSNSAITDGNSIVIRGDTAYLAANMIYAVEMADPAHPTAVKSFGLDLFFLDFIFADSFLYAIGKTSGWPPAYSFLYTYRIEGDSFVQVSQVLINGAVWSMTTYNSYLLVDAGTSGTMIFSTQVPDTPALVSCIAPAGRARESNVFGPLVITVNVIVPIPGEERPSLLCSQLIPGFPNSDDEHWRNSGDITVTDLSDPYTPVEIGRYLNPGEINSIGVHPPYVVAISDDSALHFVNPHTASLKPEYTLRLHGVPTDITSRDSLLYIGELTGLEIAVVDGINPPYLLGQYLTSRAYNCEVAVLDGYALLAQDRPGLVVVDIHDPANPTYASTATTISIAGDVVTRGQYAIVSDWWNGVATVDLTDPIHPVEVARWGVSRYDLDVKDTLLIAAGSGEVDVFNVRNPAQPFLVCSTPAHGHLAATWCGNRIVVAGNTDVSVYRFDGSSTWRTHYYESWNWTKDIACVGDTIFIASFEWVERLVFPTATDVPDGSDPNLPGTFTLSDPYPNPFNAILSIPFTVNERQHVTIEVCNMLGQKVATLLDRELPAGEQRVIWQAGNAASGVYFVRMRGEVQGGDAQTLAKRVVLVK